MVELLVEPDSNFASVLNLRSEKASPLASDLEA